ncbi:MarR family transcriptional regulator [Pseudolysobacter antarcticus]|uniref:MarR family transcriptional regulator n=1 Tax=Pseudolysobacter antarcticus TaxID=2511995 RepID=A0A411HH11_9GAMM|nr:MarR family transcriptional regulator [Pseudolysobacter antarcticus]QBB69792.1 MarR family transcriptional regulator [Pseudolysobacter antarcticus]
MKTSITTGKISTRDMVSLRLENQLCFAIYSASLAMTKLYRPFLLELNLTYPQYVVMMALWQRDAVTVSALGEQVALDSGTLTPMLKRLEALGFISRIRNPQDEREVHIRLTSAGAKLQKAAAVMHDKIACASDCSSTDRKVLTKALQQLRASLQASIQS